jgi:hypothetical protein
MQRPLAQPTWQVLHPVLSRQAKLKKLPAKQKDNVCYCLVYSSKPQDALSMHNFDAHMHAKPPAPNKHLHEPA